VSVPAAAIAFHHRPRNSRRTWSPGLRLLALSLSIAPCFRLEGQTPDQPRTWEDLVSELEPDQSLRIELRDGSSRLGRSVTVDDSSLVVRVRSGGRATAFDRTDLERVRIRLKSRAGTGLAVGAALGVGLSAAVLLAVGDFSGELEYLNFFIPLAVGLGTGALGALVGASVVTYRDYEAESAALESSCHLTARAQWPECRPGTDLCGGRGPLPLPEFPATFGRAATHP
jgi:hypothetical protein